MDFDTYAAQSRGSLLRLAVVVTDDRELAQDVVQEVLLKANQRWNRIGSLEYPHAYVRRMLSNEIISWHRKWGRVESRPARELDQAVPDPASLVDRRDALLREVARLPLHQRTAIVLRYFEDLSDEQIADTLGCRPATVRAHLHRALKTLRIEPTLEALNPIR